MENYFITQNFPVSNHVHKYLIKMHGTDHIQVSRNHFIGMIILNLHSKTFSRPPKRKKSLVKIFKVDISEFYFSRNGLFLHPDHAIIFNDTIDGIFRDEVYKNALIRKAKDEHKIIQSMRDHLEIYDITEDDIKLDSLYRDFKRKKENYQKIINVN
jgi:hypothetical protein